MRETEEPNITGVWEAESETRYTPEQLRAAAFPGM